MKAITLSLLSVCAIAATMTAADARTRHRHHHRAPVTQNEPQHYMRAAPWGPNAYYERRDPGTWSGPMNAWDRARRDDSLLSEH